MKISYWFGFISLTLLLAGCGKNKVANQAGLENSVDSAQVVANYSPDNGRSMQDLDMLVMAGPASIDQMKPYITDPEAKNRWLAVYVIGRVSDRESVQILLPLLQDSDEVVRVSAAGTLTNKGYKDALPVLIEGLSSANTITYLHPQLNIASFCQKVLTTYTGQAFTSQTDWQSWWNDHQTNLTWNSDAKKYQ